MNDVIVINADKIIFEDKKKKVKKLIRELKNCKTEGFILTYDAFFDKYTVEVQ